MHARDISSLKPQLDANHIRLVGIGLEELGLQEFRDGKFFDGDLHLDTKKQLYKKMGFQRINIFTGIGALFSKKGKAALRKAKEAGIQGNIKGDGFQSGGLVIVKPGGEVLFNYIQEHPSDFVSVEDVAKALGLSVVSSSSPKQPTMVCDEEACAMK